MTREEAVSIATTMYPTCIDTAVEVLLALSDEDEGVRSCAAEALQRLPQVEIPEPPPLPNTDSPRARLQRQLGRALAVAFAVGELRIWSAGFEDPEMDRLLGLAHGRLIAKAQAARLALDRFRGCAE